MKKLLKRSISIILFCMLLTTFNGFAANSYLEEARVFYDLGIYKGIDANHFTPDLNSFSDRETSIVFLLRLLGQNDVVQSSTEYQANNTLSSFSDRQMISDWAKKYMAFAVREKIFPDISQNELSPKRLINGKTFTAMLLKSLGYKLDGDLWTISTYIDSYLGGISASEAKDLDDKILTKNDMIGIIWKSLNIKTASGIPFIAKIVSNNNISTDRLTRLGFTVKDGNIKPPVFRTSNNGNTNISTQRYYMQDGSTYYGENLNGIPNGYGVIIYTDGSKYEGQVVNGRRDGEGKMMRIDGFIYSGKWQNDNMNGYGIFKWANGDTYTGDVVNGVFQGKGTMSWASGDSYSGNWQDGKFNGYGRFEWSNGNYYDGNWYLGEFSGYGTFHWANGEIYEGQWQNGKKNGQGKRVLNDNSVQIGVWENDVYIGAN